VSELTVLSGKGESTNCTQQPTLSTNFKIGLVLIGVPVGNLIWLAVDRESGDAVV
jgi:hypothetical protein